MDDMIEKVESGVMNITTAEVLWGGPRGDGLVHTVARLAESVETLGHTVTTLATKVTGEDGLSAQLTALKSDHQRLTSRIDGMTKWASVFACGIVTPGLLWLVGRSIQIAIQGHV